MTDRAEAFAAIRESLGAAVVDAHESAIVVAGDSLEQLRAVPDRSVSMILTDPPYHSTKKSNIRGDTDFEEDGHFLDWIGEYASEWKRVLKLNGTVYVFCATEMSARMEVTIADHLRPIANVTWTKPNEPGYDGWKGKMRKESLRAWYPHSERILMFEQGNYGSREAYRRSPFGEYLRAQRELAGLSTIQLTAAVGAFGKVNHGGAVANWEAGRNVPSREQYAKLAEAIEATGRAEEMLDYEDAVRPMNVNKDMAFTDVWDFPSVRPFKGKHPAEKPQDMLMHMVAASTYPGDIVLDCFAGSGSTGVASIRLGCRAVCMEIEEVWVDRASREIAAAAIESEHAPIQRVGQRRESLAVDRLVD